MNMTAQRFAPKRDVKAKEIKDEEKREARERANEVIVKEKRVKATSVKEVKVKKAIATIAPVAPIAPIAPIVPIAMIAAIAAITTLPPMNNVARVLRLKEHLALSKVNHEEQIMKLTTLKEANVYCVIHSVSAQQYGPLLERYIITKFNYIKNKAEDCIGDCSRDGKNTEVKVSLGGTTHTKFNFVQIRPAHNCETYILTAYHLSSENVDNEGELYVFKVPTAAIKKLVVSYGGYAHGTIKEHGSITIESLNDKKTFKDYAIRPTINDACWSELLSFRVPEMEI